MKFLLQFSQDGNDPKRGFLQTAGHSHCPNGAKVAAKFPENGRGGKAYERNLAVGIKALNGIEQPDLSNLNKVIEFGAAIAESSSQAIYQSLRVIDDLISNRAVTAPTPSSEPLGLKHAL